MLILIELFFLHFFVGQLLELSKSKLLYILVNILLFCSVLYFMLGITETADLLMYNYFYDKDITTTDFMFVILTKIFKFFNLQFLDFFKFHIILYTFAYYLFISKYTKNIFYVFFVFIVLYYVPYVNQIRYYMAFPFFLLSIYYFFTRRNLFFFTICVVISVTSHSAITILYGFIPMYYFFSSKNFFKITFYTSAFAFIVVSILFQLGILQQIEHFGEYFDKGQTSSFLGGFFNAIPYIIYILYLWYLDSNYRKTNIDFVNDKKYALLSKLSFFTIIFIPASFFVQIFGHRYVFPFQIIWIIFFLYIIRNKSPKEKFLHFLIAGFIHLLVAYSIYILPYSVLGESFYVDELQRAMGSIKYLEFLDLFKK